MRTWKLRFTREASRLISRRHPDAKKLIKQSLSEIRENPYIGKDLQEELSGFKSFKLKTYRIIYDINDENSYVQIYYMGRRRDVYEQFRYLLTELQKISSNKKDS